MHKYLVKNNISLIVVLILAIIIRLLFLGQESYWYDEIHSIHHASLESFNAIFSSLQNDVHPPLYFWILSKWIHVFGDSEFTTRLLSVVFSVSTLIALYLILRHMKVNYKTTLLTICLIGISGQHIWYSQMTRMYSMEVAIGVIHFLSLVLLLKLPFVLSCSNTILYFIKLLFFSFTSVLLIWTHFYAVFFIAADIFIILIFFIRIYFHPALMRFKYTLSTLCSSIVFLISFYSLIVIISYIPLIEQLTDRVETGHGFNWIWDRYDISFLTPFKAFSNLIMGSRIIVFSPFFRTILSLCILFLILLSVISFLSNNFFSLTNKIIFLRFSAIVYFTLLFFLPILVSFWKPIILEGNRYLIICLPFLYIIIGSAFNNSLSSNVYALRTLAKLILLSYVFYHSIYLYKYYAYREPPMWREGIEELFQRKSASDSVMIIPYYNAPVLRYYQSDFSNGVDLEDLLDGSHLKNNVWILTDQPAYTWYENVLHAAGWKLVNEFSKSSNMLGILYRLSCFNWPINKEDHQFRSFSLSDRIIFPNKNVLSFDTADINNASGFTIPDYQIDNNSMIINLSPGQGLNISFEFNVDTYCYLFDVDYLIQGTKDIYFSLLSVNNKNDLFNNSIYTQYTKEGLTNNQWNSLNSIFYNYNNQNYIVMQLVNTSDDFTSLHLNSPMLYEANFPSDFFQTDPSATSTPLGDLSIKNLIETKNFTLDSKGYIREMLSESIPYNTLDNSNGIVRSHVLNRYSSNNGPGSMSLYSNNKSNHNLANFSFNDSINKGLYVSGAYFRKMDGGNGKLEFHSFSKDQSIKSGFVFDVSNLSNDQWQYLFHTGKLSNPCDFESIISLTGNSEILLDDYKNKNLEINN